MPLFDRPQQCAVSCIGAWPKSIETPLGKRTCIHTRAAADWAKGLAALMAGRFALTACCIAMRATETAGLMSHLQCYQIGIMMRHEDHCYIDTSSFWEQISGFGNPPQSLVRAGWQSAVENTS